jgi:invasion protein IalB
MAHAQETATEDAPAASEAPAATSAPEPEAYLAETHGDWGIRCIRVEQGREPCQMLQLLNDSSGGSVAEMVVFPLPEGENAPAAAVVTTPLETLLTEDLTVVIDQGEGRRYPYSFCNAGGCVARLGLRDEDLNAFRAGNAAVIRIVPARAPDQAVLLTLSLSGFTAAYASLVERRNAN